MQIHPSTKKLIDRLYDMTLERKIEWKPGADGAVIFDTERYRVSLVGSPTEVILSSETGAELDKADHEELKNTLLDDGTTYAEYVGQLHKEAHRIARGAESAIDDVLASLDLDGDGIPDVPAAAPAVAATAAAAASTFPPAPDPAELEEAVSEPNLEDLSTEHVADAVASMAEDVNGVASAARVPEPEPAAIEAQPEPTEVSEPEPLETVVPEPVAEPVVEVTPEPVAETVVEVTPEPVTEPIVEAAPEPEPEPAPTETPTVPPSVEQVTAEQSAAAAARSAVLTGGPLGFSGFGQPMGAPKVTPVHTPDPVIEEPVVEADAAPEVPAAPEPDPTPPPPTPPVTSGYSPTRGFSTIPLSQPVQPAPTPPVEPAAPVVSQAPVPDAAPTPPMPSQPIPDAAEPAPVVEESKIADALGAITETVEDSVPEAPKSGFGMSSLAGGIAGAAGGAVKAAKDTAETATETLKEKSIGVIDETGEIIRNTSEAVVPPLDAKDEETPPDDTPKPPSKRFNPWR